MARIVGTTVRTILSERSWVIISPVLQGMMSSTWWGNDEISGDSRHDPIYGGDGDEQDGGWHRQRHYLWRSGARHPWGVAVQMFLPIRRIHWYRRETASRISILVMDKSVGD